METIVKFGCPYLVESAVGALLFLLLPAFGAMLGAFLLRGSSLRILGGAMGAASRDLIIFLLLFNGILTPTNPHYEGGVTFILAYFSASSGALGACLAPYRGKLLLLNSFLGGFLGQFILPYILVARARREAVSQ